MQLKKINIISSILVIIFISCEKYKKASDIQNIIQIDSINYCKNFEIDFGYSACVELYFTIDKSNEKFENYYLNRFEILMNEKKYIPKFFLKNIQKRNDKIMVYCIRLTKFGYTSSLKDMYEQFDDNIYLLINNDTLKINDNIKRNFFKDEERVQFNDSLNMNFHYEINMKTIKALDSMQSFNELKNSLNQTEQSRFQSKPNFASQYKENNTHYLAENAKLITEVLMILHDL